MKRVLLRDFDVDAPWSLLGNALLHQIHVDDLVAAFTIALSDDRAHGQIYNVVGPCADTHRGYVTAVAEAMGLTARIINVEDPTLLDEISILAPGIFPFGHGVDISVYSDKKFRHTFEWRPQYNLRDGMTMTYQWWLDQGHDDDDWDFSAEDAVLKRLGVEW